MPRRASEESLNQAERAGNPRSGSLAAAPSGSRPPAAGSPWSRAEAAAPGPARTASAARASRRHRRVALRRAAGWRSVLPRPTASARPWLAAWSPLQMQRAAPDSGLVTRVGFLARGLPAALGPLAPPRGCARVKRAAGSADRSPHRRPSGSATRRPQGSGSVPNAVWAAPPTVWRRFGSVERAFARVASSHRAAQTTASHFVQAVLTGMVAAAKPGGQAMGRALRSAGAGSPRHEGCSEGDAADRERRVA